MTFTLEPMSAADVEAVLEVDLAAFPEGAREVRQRHFVEELARSWGRLRVARTAGAVAGYVLFWHVTDEIHLLEVAVAPAHRRQGIGRALTELVIAYGREHAASRVLLEVRASNVAAIALYEELAFERFNVRRAYYGDGEDGVEMMLRL